MVTGHTERRNPKCRVRPLRRLVNQTQAASLLGVTREHLNRVLNGHRESRRLLAAWEKLQGEKGAGR